nr:Programmed cell death toxin MazF [Vibrio tasmaniensis]AKN37142.1 Programmed cell death toxin MazF [Vibrio genomosp. F6]
MNLDKPSVVASSLIQTLSWKDRNAKKITTAENGVMEDVLLRLIPLIGAESLFEE